MGNKSSFPVFVLIVIFYTVSAQGIKANAAAVDMAPPLEMKVSSGATATV